MKTRHHVAVQMEEEQQWQKDNGPIVKTADQLWKYSGETEEYTEEFDVYLRLEQASNMKTNEFNSYYKQKIKDKDIYLFLTRAESKVIDCFYKNCNTMTIPEMAIDTGRSKDYIKRVIEKHIKIQQDDKKYTSKRPKGNK